MYVLYLDLNEFLDHAGPIVHLEAQCVGTELTREATIVLTSRRVPHGPIHGARIVVAHAGITLIHPQSILGWVQQAMALLDAVIAQRGFQRVPGVCLEPGMYDDLRKIETAQDMFAIRRNGHSSCAFVRTAAALTVS
ncbi:MAG: hypothetical protein HC828_18470 [Blastochloris sp.]|nr:hypothetical protein [Blastochloris sp.]